MTAVHRAPGGTPWGSRLWWGMPVLIGILWIGGLTSAVRYPGLPSPPDITYWLLPATRYARDIAAALTVGAVLVGGLVVPGGSSRVLGWAIRWAAGWLMLVVLGLVLTRSEVEALSPLEALSPNSLMPLLVNEIVGRVLVGQFLALMAVMGLAWALRANRGRRELLSWTCVVLAVSAAAAPAFVGHSGLHDSHVAATVSLLVHIAAVSLWVGGLVVVVALLRVEPETSMVVLQRFSLMALWCVVLIAETGLLNASLRLTLPSEFVGTLYGSVIIGKAALLGWLVSFGYLQRQVLMGTVSARGLLARYAVSEFFIMGVAIALSIVLARVGPAPTGAATGGYSPIALSLLGVAVPMLIVHLRVVLRGVGQPSDRRLWRRADGSQPRALDWLRGHSEVPAVLLLVAAADIAGLQALNSVFGIELGTIVGVMVILGAGWLWAECLVSKQAVAGILVVMVGWPVVIWVNGLGQTSGGGAGFRLTIATIVAVEVLLGARLVKTMQAANVVSSGVSSSRTLVP